MVYKKNATKIKTSPRDSEKNLHIGFQKKHINNITFLLDEFEEIQKSLVSVVKRVT